MAVKVVRLTSEDVWHICIREFETQRGLSHANIAKAMRLLLDAERRLSYMLMEYVPGLPLSDRIDAQLCFSGARHTESSAKSVARQCFSALAYLHAQDIVHRDICPSNLLLTGEILTIVDFQTACDSQCAKGVVGTKPYQAPEMWDQQYGCKVDVWSAAAVLTRLLRGSALSQSCQCFLDRCSDPDPGQRCSAAEALDHPWLQ